MTTPFTNRDTQNMIMEYVNTATPTTKETVCFDLYSGVIGRKIGTDISYANSKIPIIMYQQQKKIQKTIGVSSSSYMDSLNVITSYYNTPQPIDNKHGSYIRYLNNKKGKNSNKRCINPNGYNKGDAKHGNKLYSTNISKDFSCNKMVRSSIPLSQTTPQKYNNAFQYYLKSQDPSTIIQRPYDIVYNFVVGAQVLYTNNDIVLDATILSVNNDGTYTISVYDPLSLNTNPTILTVGISAISYPPVCIDRCITTPCPPPLVAPI